MIKYFTLGLLIFVSSVYSQNNSPSEQYSEQVKIKFGVTGIVNGVVGKNAFWGLDKAFNPQYQYDPDKIWLESSVKPYVDGSYNINKKTILRGGATLVFSSTLGKDYFDQGNTGRVEIEKSYLGIKYKFNKSKDIDFSAGQQEYTLGNLMLIAVGAGNGFERGSLTTFPFRSWKFTGLLKFRVRKTSFNAFYLQPNDLKSNPTNTQLAGGNIDWLSNKSNFAGVYYVNAYSSNAPYPQAPINIIADGRKGLNVFGLYFKYEPDAGSLKGLSIIGEGAYELNSRIDMNAYGGGIKLGFNFSKVKFFPKIIYSFRYFSGDDPNTSDLERFDPLYYMASPDTWSSGGSSSLVFLNTNNVVHAIRLEIAFSQKDFFNVNYWYVQAAQINSPIQFGQGARVSSTGTAIKLISGVPEKKLSDEFYAEYTRALSANWYLTAGFAFSIPGSGLEKSAGNELQNWVGALLNVSFNF